MGGKPVKENRANVNSSRGAFRGCFVIIKNVDCVIIMERIVSKELIIKQSEMERIKKHECLTVAFISFSAAVFHFLKKACIFHQCGLDAVFPVS